MRWNVRIVFAALFVVNTRDLLVDMHLGIINRADANWLKLAIFVSPKQAFLALEHLVSRKQKD
jgi:hypothetical protein